jgi:hypothetical protein
MHCIMLNMYYNVPLKKYMPRCCKNPPRTPGFHGTQRNNRCSRIAFPKEGTAIPQKGSQIFFRRPSKMLMVYLSYIYIYKKRPHYLETHSRMKVLRRRNQYSLKLYIYVRFEVFKAMIMKNVVFWDVAPCRSCLSRRFGGM